MPKALLWQGVELPKWGDGSPERLLQLFELVSKGSSKKVHDEYCRYLMVLISAAIGRGNWIRTFRGKKVDAEDAAQKVLIFLFRKTIEKRFRLRHRMPLVLVTLISRAINNKLVSILRGSVTRSQEVQASQYGVMAGEEFDEINIVAPATADVDGLIDHLSECRDVICGSDEDQENITRLYQELVQGLIDENAILTHSQLSSSLRRRISIDQHTAVAYRFNKAIRDFVTR